MIQSLFLQKSAKRPANMQTRKNLTFWEFLQFYSSSIVNLHFSSFFAPLHANASNFVEFLSISKIRMLTLIEIDALYISVEKTMLATTYTQSMQA